MFLSVSAQEGARRLDKFYTRPETVEQCLEHLRSVAPDLAAHDLWIEPSAGAGAFLTRLPHPRIGIDIAPETPEAHVADFLTWGLDALPEDFPCRDPIVVGNPPFGRSAAMAVAFFNHAAGMARRIAFIVPRTFEKASIQARLDRRFHLDCSFPLPMDSFLFLDEPYLVPCAWQVWTRRDAPRAILRGALQHPDFAFVRRTEADFAFQRVGVRAGAVKSEFGHVADASHLFLRAMTTEPGTLVGRIAGLDFSAVRASTAGNPSISKRELVAAYAARYGGGDRCGVEGGVES